MKRPSATPPEAARIASPQSGEAPSDDGCDAIHRKRCRRRLWIANRLMPTPPVLVPAKPVGRPQVSHQVSQTPTTIHEPQQTPTDTLTASIKASANTHEPRRTLVFPWHGRGQEFNSPKLHSFECGTAPVVPHLWFWVLCWPGLVW